MTRLRLIHAEWTTRDIQMRLPFQFGNTEVWGAPEACLEVLAEIEGKVFSGRSAQLMVPRWFNKDQAFSNEDTIDELRSVVNATVGRVPGREGSVCTVTRDLRQDVTVALPDMPTLAAGFGPALVEMAVIDALCSAVGLPFWKAARADVFGLASDGPADIRQRIAPSLSAISAPNRVTLRHTIGFDAPLRSEEVSADTDDARPIALEDVLAATGIRALKIKLKGDPERDLERLRKIGELISDLNELSVTLDANEQYSTGLFADFVEVFLQDPSLKQLRDATRFVEQPFPRETALDQPVTCPIPLIIDESDDTEDAFARALAMGWSGTSIKSCKGVLRALLNKVRAEVSGSILSGEDLTCQPGLCWQQDIAMMSACGVRDVERNGHHFAGGMQGVTPSARAAFLRDHPDIYRLDGDHIALRIADGAVRIGSLDVAGFGVGFEPESLIDKGICVTY